MLSGRPQVEELGDEAVELLVEPLEVEPKGLLGLGGVDGDVGGANVAAGHQDLFGHGVGEQALGHGFGVVPPRFLAEDKARAAGLRAEAGGGDDVAARNVVDVDRRSGEGGAKVLAQEHAQDHGVGPLHTLVGGGDHAVAAQDEGRVQVDDVESRSHVGVPGLGGLEGGDLGVGVGGELGVVRACCEGHAVCWADGLVGKASFCALHLGNGDESHDGRCDDYPSDGTAGICRLQEADGASNGWVDEVVGGELALDGGLSGAGQKRRGDVDDMGDILHSMVEGTVHRDVWHDDKRQALEEVSVAGAQFCRQPGEQAQSLAF